MADSLHSSLASLVVSKAKAETSTPRSGPCGVERMHDTRCYGLNLACGQAQAPRDIFMGLVLGDSSHLQDAS